MLIRVRDRIVNTDNIASIHVNEEQKQVVIFTVAPVLNRQEGATDVHRVRMEWNEGHALLKEIEKMADYRVAG